MDLLFSKYASPFVFLDGMIQYGRFFEFVVEFINIKNESDLWEFYLHKIMDKSFNDFKDELKNDSSGLNASKEELETTVINSMSIINGFMPN